MQTNKIVYFVCYKTSCFCFFGAHSRLFGLQSLLQINFSSDCGWKRKELRNVTGLTCLLSRHDYKILKLRIICKGTKSLLICKSSVYFCAHHFVCSGNGIRHIVILKTKIKPVSINADANCNEPILRFDDVMPTLFSQCSCPNYPINLSTGD